jgi:hypothetical protein
MTDFLSVALIKDHLDQERLVIRTFSGNKESAKVHHRKHRNKGKGSTERISQELR